MPVSIDWGTKIITVSQSFLTLVSGVLYELDVNELHLALKDLEDDEAGMPFPKTHNHNTQVTLSGVTYARIVEILSPYTLTFEDVGPHYTVRCVGANHNIADVLNFNSVNLIVGNSGGLILGIGSAPSAGDVANAVWSHATATDLLDKVTVAEAILRNKSITDPVTGVMTVYDTDGVTPLLTAQMYEGISTAQTYRGQGAERRERLA